jgi:hypothetical protein
LDTMDQDSLGTSTCIFTPPNLLLGGHCLDGTLYQA